MAVRTTVYVDDAVLERARRQVGERGLSRLVNQALTEKLDAIEERQIEEQMREGYLASREERAALNEDWQSVDGERWPE
jgi:hypothetical protein